MLQTIADTSVANPDPNPDPDPPDSDPPDPHVFGPPGSGSGSISQRYGSATLADAIAKAYEYTVTKVYSFARQAQLINTNRNRETYFERSALGFIYSIHVFFRCDHAYSRSKPEDAIKNVYRQ
jgi:hypothetical protein